MNQAIGQAQIYLACCIGACGLFVSPALAQVNGPGPSPSGLFDTVLNLPGDETVITGAAGESIGGVAEQTVQLNVNDGGTVGRSFDAFSGSEVNFSGGTTGFTFEALSDSEVNISGGILGAGSRAESGSVVNISGGEVGEEFRALLGSQVNISGGIVGNNFASSGSELNISGGDLGDFASVFGSLANISGGTVGYFFLAGDVTLIGGEFRLNGADYSGSTITLRGENIFTGTLADGSSFIFSSDDGPLRSDALANVALTRTDLPDKDLTPIVISSPSVSGSSGLRAGQTLTLQAGGSLRANFAVVDATLNVEGGTVGKGAEATNGVVNISGGAVGEFFRAFSGSQVNISGGTVGISFDAYHGSVVNVSGGNMGSTDAWSGSEMNISGGNVGSIDAQSGSVVNVSGGNAGFLRARTGSAISISGGALARYSGAVAGSDGELIGGEFRLNGADFSESTITLPTGGVFTGTLADGSSFILSSAAGDGFIDVTLTAATLPVADLNPTLINTPIVSGPSGLRAGQTMTLQTGGSLRDDFAVVDATLNVEGGTVGAGAEASNSVVNISGGTVGNGFNALHGSVVNISGGEVGLRFDAYSGSVVNISGGNVSPAAGPYDGEFKARVRSTVNISGGNVSNFAALFGSVANISGGTVNEDFHSSGSVVNLLGSEFFIDGEELDNLLPGEAFTIVRENQNQTISGSFANGTPFSFALKSDRRGGTFTVTLVSSLGDVNLDGVMDLSDIPAFIAILATRAYRAQADCNQDGVVNFLDVHPFIQILLSA